MADVQSVNELIKRGFNVIPIKPKSKEPALDSWKEFQYRRVTDSEIGAWWGMYPQLGVAVVTGSISGVFVLDVDTKNGGSVDGREIPETLTARTPSGGLHYYFRLPKGEVIRCRNGVMPGLDIKGEGGYVLAPPTPGYVWIDPDKEIADPPQWLLELIRKSAQRNLQEDNSEEEESWIVKVLTEGVAQGARDDTAIRIAGYLARRGLEIGAIKAILLDWNKKNKPPMGSLPGDENPEQWAQRKAESAWRMEQRRREENNHPDRLIEELSKAETVQHKKAVLERLAESLKDAPDEVVNFYVDEAKKVSKFDKPTIRKFIEKFRTKRSDTNPVALKEPVELRLYPSQYFYKGIMYYGLWLPLSPDASKPEDFVFKIVTSERKLIDPPEGLPIPLFQVGMLKKWSLDEKTPYNVFEWLNGTREVDGLKLLRELEELFRKYVWFPNPRTPLVLALWVMMTYVYMIADQVSYLTFVGTKRSGKSRTLDLLERLSYNAVNLSQASVSAFARTVGMYQATAIVDEAVFPSALDPTKTNKKDDWETLLLNTHRKGVPYARSEGEQFNTRTFDPYSPKAIVSMYRIPDALIDRAIYVHVARAKPGQVADLVFSEIEDDLQLLRNQLHFFGLTYARRIADTIPNILVLMRQHQLTDRERDIWLVPLAIAYVVGGEQVFSEAIEFAKGSMVEKEAEDLNSFTAAVITACRDLLVWANDPSIEDELKPVLPKEKGYFFTMTAIKRLVARYLGVDESQVSSHRISRELVSVGIIENTSSKYVIRVWNGADGKRRGERAYKLTNERVMDAVVRYRIDDTLEGSTE